MSLLFDHDAEHVSINHASLDRLDALTLMLWYRVDSVAASASYAALSKLLSPGTDQLYLTRPIYFPYPDDWVFYHRRTVTSTFVRTSGNLVQAGRWEWLCVLDSDGEEPEMLHATLTTPPVEPPYLARTTGAGTVPDDSGQPMHIGRLASLGSQSFMGRIGFLAIYNRRMGLSEAKAHWRRPRPAAGCVHFCHAGLHGLSWVDLSGAGSHGTPAGGPTLAPRVPLAMPLMRPAWTVPSTTSRRVTLGGLATASPRVVLVD